MTTLSLRKFVESKFFHKTVSIVIILCAIVLGVETMITDPFSLKLFVIMDILITSFFIVEIVLRIFAEDSLLSFFKLARISRKKTSGKMIFSYSEDGFWNWFDFIITTVSTIAIFTHFFEHPEYLLIARMFRIFRIFRLLEVSSQLKEIEKKIVRIVPTVFSFALLLFILIYIYSIVGYYLFEGQAFASADFSSLYNSMTTLFQVMTLDGWGEIMADVNDMHLKVTPFVISIYFISFVIFTAIVSLNVFIGVMASSVESKFTEKIDEEKKLIIDETDHTDIIVTKGFEQLLTELASVKEDMKNMSQTIQDMKNK